jgi:hypothetical protein
MAALADDETAADFTLEALKVVHTSTGCGTVTRFEYKNVTCYDDAGEMGCWTELRADTDVMINLDEGEAMNVVLTITQDSYLNTLVTDFNAGVDYGSVLVECRFVTEDPANKWAYIHDYVYVNFISSQETEADFCASDVDALYIEDGSAMTKDRNY